MIQNVFLLKQYVATSALFFFFPICSFCSRSDIAVMQICVCSIVPVNILYKISCFLTNLHGKWLKVWKLPLKRRVHTVPEYRQTFSVIFGWSELVQMNKEIIVKHTNKLLTFKHYNHKKTSFLITEHYKSGQDQAATSVFVKSAYAKTCSSSNVH